MAKLIFFLERSQKLMAQFVTRWESIMALMPVSFYTFFSSSFISVTAMEGTSK